MRVVWTILTLAGMAFFAALAGMQDPGEPIDIIKETWRQRLEFAARGTQLAFHRACNAPLLVWCRRHGFYRWIGAEEAAIEHKPNLASDSVVFRAWQHEPIRMELPLNPTRWPEYTHEPEPSSDD